MQKSEHDRLMDRLCTEPPDVIAKLLGELKRPYNRVDRAPMLNTRGAKTG